METESEPRNDLKLYNLSLKECPHEYYGQYINLYNYKDVRINAKSKNNAILIIEYSNYKSSVDMYFEHRLPADRWISVFVEPKLKYFRIHIKQIEDGGPCEVNYNGVSNTSSWWFY